MAQHEQTIDVSDIPDILHLAEEVHRAGERRVLRKDGEDLAMVVPLPRIRKKRFRKPTAADIEAFRSAAGSWGDIDADALIAEIYATRRKSNRPPAEL